MHVLVPGAVLLLLLRFRLGRDEVRQQQQKVQSENNAGLAATKPREMKGDEEEQDQTKCRREMVCAAMIASRQIVLRHP